MSSLRPKSQSTHPTKPLSWLLPANSQLHDSGHHYGSRPFTIGKESDAEGYPTLLIKTIVQPRERVKSAEQRVLLKQRSTESLGDKEKYPPLREEATSSVLRLTGSQINLSDFIDEKQLGGLTNPHSKYVALMKNRHSGYLKKQLKRGPSLIRQRSQEYPQTTEKITSISMNFGEQKPKKVSNLTTTLTEIRKKLYFGFTRSNEPVKNDLRSLSYSPMFSSMKSTSFMQAQGTKLRLKPKRNILQKHLF